MMRRKWIGKNVLPYCLPYEWIMNSIKFVSQQWRDIAQYPTEGNCFWRCGASMLVFSTMVRRRRTMGHHVPVEKIVSRVYWRRQYFQSYVSIVTFYVICSQIFLHLCNIVFIRPFWRRSKSLCAPKVTRGTRGTCSKFVSIVDKADEIPTKDDLKKSITGGTNTLNHFPLAHDFCCAL